MNDKGAKLTMPVPMLWVEMQAGRQEAERSRDGLVGQQQVPRCKVQRCRTPLWCFFL